MAFYSGAKIKWITLSQNYLKKRRVLGTRSTYILSLNISDETILIKLFWRKWEKLFKFAIGYISAINLHLSLEPPCIYVFIGSPQELTTRINHAITWRFWLVIKRMTADRVFIACFFMTFLFTLSICWSNLSLTIEILFAVIIPDNFIWDLIAWYST